MLFAFVLLLAVALISSAFTQPGVRPSTRASNPPSSRAISLRSSQEDKRDLTPEGWGRFLAPNATSLAAACYPLEIEFYSPGPPRNLTAWFEKGGESFFVNISEFSRVENPWIDENTSLFATWERLSIGPGTLVSIIVQGYLDDVAESTAFTVQPSNDRSCYNSAFTGDASWAGTTGLGITTTFAPSASTGGSGCPVTTSLPSDLPQGQPNDYRPSAAIESSSPLSPAQTAGSNSSFTPEKKSTSLVVPIVVAVIGVLVLGGIAAFVVFWRKRKGKDARRAPGEAGAGDDAPYVVDLIGGGGAGAGMGEAGARETIQVQPWNYSPASGISQQTTPSSGVNSSSNLLGSPSSNLVASPSGVMQERDGGIQIPVDTVPPDYADATGSSMASPGSYFALPTSQSSSSYHASSDGFGSERRSSALGLAGSGKSMRG